MLSKDIKSKIIERVKFQYPDLTEDEILSGVQILVNLGLQTVVLDHEGNETAVLDVDFSTIKQMHEIVFMTQ